MSEISNKTKLETIIDDLLNEYEYDKIILALWVASTPSGAVESNRLDGVATEILREHIND